MTGLVNALLWMKDTIIAVREVFVILMKRFNPIVVNVSSTGAPRCATALSDVEVEHEDEHGHLWHINIL